MHIRVGLWPLRVVPGRGYRVTSTEYWFRGFRRVRNRPAGVCMVCQEPRHAWSMPCGAGVEGTGRPRREGGARAAGRGVVGEHRVLRLAAPRCISPLADLLEPGGSHRPPARTEQAASATPRPPARRTNCKSVSMSLKSPSSSFSTLGSGGKGRVGLMFRK